MIEMQTRGTFIGVAWVGLMLSLLGAIYLCLLVLAGGANLSSFILYRSIAVVLLGVVLNTILLRRLATRTDRAVLVLMCLSLMITLTIVYSLVR
jgi:hypothetical protein